MARMDEKPLETAYPAPIFTIEGHCWATELHVVRTSKGNDVELLLLHEGSAKMLRFINPQPLDEILSLWNGFDVIQVFDRREMDAAWLEFGRYRIKWFIDDDDGGFDADRFAVEDLSAPKS